jgi:hypothetical protein
MALEIFGTTVGTGTGTALQAIATVPAGCCGVVLSAPGTGTVYVGAGTNLSTTNGYQVVGGAVPVSFPVVPAAKTGPVLYALASATGIPLGVIISTDG